jgi:hypothetical protein
MSAKLLTLPEFMSVVDVAEWRGVTRACVYGWIKSGKIDVDHKRKGGGAMIRPEAVQAAFDQSADYDADEDEEIPNINDERALHEAAKRKKAELDLAARAGELLDADDVRDTWIAAATVTRQRVLGCIPSISAQLAATDSQHEVTQLLEHALREALTLTAADIMETDQ